MTTSLRVILGIAIACVALVAYDAQRLDPQKLGLDSAMQSKKETWGGRQFTTYALEEVDAVLDAHRAIVPASRTDCPPQTVLWLGNSQLHFINQFKPGDHVAPYWLRRGLPCPDNTVPLTFSLANGNLQEHYVLAKYVVGRIELRTLLVGLVFDDLREDGLRDEFATLLKPEDLRAQKDSPVARAIIEHAQAGWQGRDKAQENGGLEGFGQKHIEDALSQGLARVSSLWADRPNLRVNVLFDLFNLRNALFGIKPTTVRKMIQSRYVLNMNALQALLGDMRERGVHVVLYIAPIRQDIQLPYAPDAYSAWKTTVQNLAAEYGARYANVEDVVPGGLWGTLINGDVDFMHFQGGGHKILGAALAPYVDEAARTATHRLTPSR